MVGWLGVQVPLKGPCLRHGCLNYQFGVVSLETKNLLLQFYFVVLSHWVKQYCSNFPNNNWVKFKDHGMKSDFNYSVI